QARKVPPRMDQCFLDGVLGPLSIPKDQVRDRIESVTGGCREDLKGLVIATPCRLNDLALHGLLHQLRDLGGRAITLRRPAASKRSRIHPAALTNVPAEAVVGATDAARDGA